MKFIVTNIFLITSGFIINAFGQIDKVTVSYVEFTPSQKDKTENVKDINFRGDINSVFSCGSITIKAADLVKKRKPNTSYFTRASFNELMPLECIKSINNQIVDLENRWQNDDLNEWGRLANQYCSHYNGWVEYTPGSCQAGGPPPVCPVKHWYKDPQNAMSKWEKEQEKVRIKREQEMNNLKSRLVKSACSCWAKDIDNNTRIEQRAKDKVEAETSGFFKILSFDGTCPPGYELKEGYCIPVTSSIVTGPTISNNTNLKYAEKTNEVKDMADPVNIGKDLVIDDIKTSLSSIKLVDKFISLFKSAGKWGTISLSIATTFFSSMLTDPSLITTEIGVYQSELNLLNTNIYTANNLMEEYQRLKTSAVPCLCREEKYIKEDLGNLRKELLSRIKNINLHADFAVKTFEIRDNACPEAFIAFTRKLNELSISVLNNLHQIQ